MNRMRRFVTDYAHAILLWLGVALVMVVIWLCTAEALDMRGFQSSPSFSSLTTITGTTEQLRLAYDATNYASFTVGSTGGLTVNPTGTSDSTTLKRNQQNYIVLSGSVPGFISFGPGISSNTTSDGFGLGMFGATFTGTSGAHAAVHVSTSFAPTSTSTMTAFGINVAPTINYSAGTPGAGSYEGIRVNITETALPTGTNYFARFGTGGGTFTSKVDINRTGIISAVGGGSTSLGTVPVLMTSSVTSTGTDADTNEKTLWTYDLPANTLNANGRVVRIIASGTFAANANNKTVLLYFGSSTMTTTTVATNNGHWTFTAFVYRTGSNTQVMPVFVDYGLNDGSTVTRRGRQRTPGETDTAAITIKVTGQNGSANANDIVFTTASVEVLN